MRELTESERTTLTNALYVAAERFKENAASLRKEPGHTRMAEQFDQQEKDSRKLAEDIEQAESLRLS